MNRDPITTRKPRDAADPTAASPREQLGALRHEVVVQAKQQLERFSGRFPSGEFSPSAVNFAHYLALRRFDLRVLQDTLADAGLSSLGRCEAHVLASLDHVIGLLVGETVQPAADPASGFRAGRERLAENTQKIFGPKPGHRDTRIMVTLPAYAADDYPMIRELINSGMDCARINCAHDDPDVWEKLVANVRRAGEETGRRCRILIDLEGHKLRTGPLETIPAVIHIKVERDRYGRMLAPATIVLEPDAGEAMTVAARELSSPYRFRIPADLHRRLRRGDRLNFKDTRAKARHFTLLDRDEHGRWIAECPANTYISRDAVLHPERSAASDRRQRLETFRFVDFPVEAVEIRLKIGDRLRLSAQPVHGMPADPGPADADHAAVIGCSHPAALARLTAGQPAWIDDGKIGGLVETVDANGVTVRITEARPEGSCLRADKGINFPGADLGLSGLSADDIANLDFVCRHADMVGFSFVETLADIDQLITELVSRHAYHLSIIAKIETRRAVVNLPELILGTIGRFPLGIMIARGDLAVEIGGERLSEIQEELLWLAEAAHVPVIWATQVLETLTKKGNINRAELTDAAMSARAECVMLNKGPYVCKAVRTLDDILSRLRQHQYKKFSLYRALHW
jgi:pyruvate kinase